MKTETEKLGEDGGWKECPWLVERDAAFCDMSGRADVRCMEDNCPITKQERDIKALYHRTDVTCKNTALMQEEIEKITETLDSVSSRCKPELLQHDIGELKHKIKEQGIQIDILEEYLPPLAKNIVGFREEIERLKKFFEAHDKDWDSAAETMEGLWIRVVGLEQEVGTLEEKE